MSSPAPDVRQVLLRAIQIEARNGEIYESLASIFQGYDDSVLSLFCEMAAEEREHGAHLQQRYRQLFGAVPSRPGEPTEIIEAVDLEDAETLIFDSMTVGQALATGIRTEQQAREFYRQEALRTTDPALQQMYRELADYEETHVRLLEEKLLERMRAKSASR